MKHTDSIQFLVRDIRIPYTAHPMEAIEKAKKQFQHALGRGRSADILDAVLRIRKGR